jgi:alkylation response protein AidB-like acyl-CoA dehydrogenase
VSKQAERELAAFEVPERMVTGGGGVYAILTEEQEMLRALAGSIAERFGLAMPRDLESVDPEAAWAVLDDAGLLALRERDDNGRPASSGIEVMIVTRELAGKLVPVPFGPSGVLANELLALSAGEGGRRFRAIRVAATASHSGPTSGTSRMRPARAPLCAGEPSVRSTFWRCEKPKGKRH